LVGAGQIPVPGVNPAGAPTDFYSVAGAH
jgi:hypothetical protein